MSVPAAYIHLPFCLRKCAYCDFNSRPGTPEELEAYLRAVRRELQDCREQLTPYPATVYLGGGTPTLYAPRELVGLLEGCGGRLPHPFSPSPCGRGGEGRPAAPCEEGEQGCVDTSGQGEGQAGKPVLRVGAEVSVEANPGTVTLGSMEVLRSGGFNRISLGVQSLRDEDLRLLGRAHTAREAREAVEFARRAGFANLSLDLIRGLPGQRLQDWKWTVDAALDLGPDHLSAYGLTLEEGTPLRERVQRGELPAPGGADDPRWVEWTVERLHAAGLERYEVSNYCRPGFECRHNLTYWRNEPYLGAGAGAWSYLGGERSRNVTDPAEYARRVGAGEDLVEERERLEPEAALGETIMLGLRLVRGVRRADLLDRFGVDIHERYAPVIDRLVRGGLAVCDAESLRLTFQGMLVHNAVAVEFLA